jgi:cytochrome c553
MAIMLSTTLVAAGGAQTQAGAQKTDTTPRGAAIVAHGTSAGAVACARCHGFDGRADGSGAVPILANQHADSLSKQLRDFASGTRLNAIMTPMAKALTDEEIDAAAPYSATVHATTVPPPARAPDLVTRGAALATTGETARQVLPCTACHGQKGVGEPPVTPYLAGQYLVSQMGMFNRGSRKNALLDTAAHNLAEGDYEALGASFEGLPRPAAESRRAQGDVRTARHRRESVDAGCPQADAAAARRHGPRGVLSIASVAVGRLFRGGRLCYFVLCLGRGAIG